MGFSFVTVKVLNSYAAVKIALTATPALHTPEIFGKPVYSYDYRTAVMDGYLVDHDAPHIIKTKLSEEGIRFEKGATVPIYDPVKIKEAIRRFKNETYPNIVVTVDLLTTGIDVEEIENLVFMRRIRSRILFEQMLGRATRLCPRIGKTHFEIYDAVGVYNALLPVSNMKPVVANPATSFDDL